jgi:5-methylcytosine-specific restriction endonuclease McrA
MGRKRGFHQSEVTKEKLRVARTGKHHSQETIEKIRKTSSGRTYGPQTSERKEKTRLAVTGEKHWLFGKHHSEETKKKIGASLKGIVRGPHTPEHSKKLGATRAGEKHFNWKGGISFEPYCVKFNQEFKERVRGFFGYQCQMCGRVWHEGETKLSVHHVNFRKDSCCADGVLPLFVPVCSGKCHCKTNYNRFFWEYWFTEMINWLYDGKCYLPKQV